MSWQYQVTANAYGWDKMKEAKDMSAEEEMSWNGQLDFLHQIAVQSLDHWGRKKVGFDIEVILYSLCHSWLIYRKNVYVSTTVKCNIPFSLCLFVVYMPTHFHWCWTYLEIPIFIISASPSVKNRAPSRAEHGSRLATHNTLVHHLRLRRIADHHI